MRLLLLLILFLLTSALFGQGTTFDSMNKPVCTLSVNCVTISDDKPIRPFISAGYYLGKIIIQAQLDTLTMKLIRHKIIYADLHSKFDSNEQIKVRLDEQSGNTKYLDTILPDLINH